MISTNQSRPLNTLEFILPPFDPGRNYKPEEKSVEDVSRDRLLKSLKTELLSYFKQSDRKLLKSNIESNNFAVIIKLIRKNRWNICRDSKNIFNPFIRPTRLINTLESILKTNVGISFPFWRVHMESLFKNLPLPTKMETAISGPNSYNGFLPCMDTKSLFSKQVICEPIQQTQNSSSIFFTCLPVERIARENMLKAKIKKGQKKRIIRVMRQTKDTCTFVERKRVNGSYVGKSCGKVLINNEEKCPAHKDKESHNLELHPYTCKFVISQAQGKNRERSRKGLECGLICEEGKEKCNIHIKSENYPLDPKDCRRLVFADEDGKIEYESPDIIMPPKQEVTSVIRCIKIRARLTKEQIKVYTKSVGDCRKTWNILTANQDRLGKNPDKEELRAGIVNNLPNNLNYLRDTPKDCRDSVLGEFCDSVKNMHDQYDKKVQKEIEDKAWCIENDIKCNAKKAIKIPRINFRTKNQDQVLSIAKSAVTLSLTGIKLYPRFFGKDEIKVNNRIDRKYSNKPYDKKYLQIFQQGLKHDIKLIKTRANKFYFTIPYDVPKKNTQKTKDFGTTDNGCKTFATISNSQGECISYGDGCDRKVKAIHTKIDALNKLLYHYKEKEITHKIDALKRKIAALEDHLKNKVIDLHYHVIKDLIEYKRFYIPHFANKQMERSKSTNKDTKRQMNCLSHYQFSQRLKSKAEENGSEVYVSDEYRTTMTCGSCFKKNIVNGREFSCIHCGFKWFRDANAARNNVLKYLA